MQKFEIPKDPRQFLDLIVYIFKASKRVQKALGLAALLFGLMFFSSWLPGELKDFLNQWKVLLIAQISLFVSGLIALAVGCWGLKKLVWAEELPPAKNRPLAIKGPEAFTEADGELFRKLGREGELQKLLDWALDNQVLMIVVRGASGAGKTSLLRAGLKNILGDKAIVHYWEAMPTEPEKKLRHAIQETWPNDAKKPLQLDSLINPHDELGRQAHVIVLDQFEQLRGNDTIFEQLRKIIRESERPYRITWIIAFRREFAADWDDFINPEEERGFRSLRNLPLKLFSAEQAKRITNQLVQDADLHTSINADVINNLVEAATVESEVSPVDIGIGLLVLAELHERQSGQTITIRDYQFAGGAEGLLTQYISRCLELFPKESQEAILKAMLALRDPETNQRLAEGLTVDELAAESGAEARLLKTQLDRLSHRDTRLLETVTPSDGSPIYYRLPHERLIPALYRLTGKLLAEVDQAKQKFQNAFQAWKINDKGSHYLLKAKELRLIERYVAQIPWGNDEQEKKEYLNRSKRHRQFVRAAAVTAGLTLIVLGWMSVFLYQRFEHKKFLGDESGYPPKLYDYQHQLKKLELTESLNLDRFTWLSSDSIEELSLQAASSSNSIAGLSSLSRCRLLKKLTLDLRGSQVSNLEPLAKLKNLTHLTLDLRGSQVRSLEPLAKLGDLVHLTLNLNGVQVSDLEPVAQLSNLTQLTIDLFFIPVSNLESLSKLRNLTHLTLNLNSGPMGYVESVAKLNNLTHLTLNLSGPVSSLEPLAKLSNRTHLTLVLNNPLGSLEPLAKLSNLAHLTLIFSSLPYVINNGNSQVTSLEPLAKLSNLQQLTLSLNGSQVSDLEPLAKLSNLTHLTLDLAGSQVSGLEPLTKLSNLEQFRLNLLGSQVNDLEPLAKLSHLAQLVLNLSGSQVNNLESLAKLSNLTHLMLGLSFNQPSNLEMLAKLSNLTHLTLGLSFNQPSNLEPLAKLSNLTHLTLNLNGTQVGNWETLGKLSNLTHLALIFSALPYGISNSSSQVSSLEPLLTKLSNLQQLTLSLSGSQVSNLEPLTKLPSLQSLSIESVTRAQRMSLRNLPASLVELKF